MSNFKKAVLLVILCYSLSVLGQDTIVSLRTQKTPTHGAHDFIYLTGARTPEINTEVFTFMGYGETSDFEYPILDFGDRKALGLKGSVVFVDLNAKYQQRFRDWLAVYVRYHLASRIGTDVQSLLGHGINTITSLEIGWKFKIYEGDKSILSTNIELQNHNGNFMNIAGFVEDIVNDNPIISITQNIPVLTGGLGVQYAYGINDLFGISLYFDLGYGETYVRGKNATRFLGGASVDVNFNKRFDIPLGLALNVSLTSEPELVYVDDRIAKIILFKIAYTGASDFSIGIEAGGVYTPMPGAKDEPFVGNVGLASRFYF